MANPFVGLPTFQEDAASFALDQFGIDQTQFTDALVVGRVPRTRTRTSHALLIKAENGRLIGAAHALTVNQTRQVDDEWEIDRAGRGGVPADMVPQNLTGRTIQIERFDLFTRLMEEVFGDSELVTLADQFRPFKLQTVWQSPVGALLGGRRIYVYEGCWFQSLGRTARSDDNRIVNVNAQIGWQRRRRVL